MNAPHIGDELAALLRGELDRTSTAAAGRHLRGCDECRRDLVDIAIAHGSLAAARRVEELIAYDTPVRDERGGGVGVPADLRPLRSPTALQRRRVAGLVASVAVVLGLSLAAVTGVFSSPSTVRPLVAMARLRPPSRGIGPRGEVMIRAHGEVMEMSVVTRGLADAPADDYYEVWLVQPATRKMMPVGLLDPSGTGHYALRAKILDQFLTIEISLQPNNGSPRPSAKSVLEGQMTEVE